MVQIERKHVGKPHDLPDGGREAVVRREADARQVLAGIGRDAQGIGSVDEGGGILQPPHTGSLLEIAVEQACRGSIGEEGRGHGHGPVHRQLAVVGASAVAAPAGERGVGIRRGCQGHHCACGEGLRAVTATVDPRGA